MCLSFTVKDIYGVEYWRDREMWVRRRSKPLKMAPIDRSYDVLLVWYCNYSSIVYRFRVI